MGRLPEAWIAPPWARELRELTRYRIKLVGIRTPQYRDLLDQARPNFAAVGASVRAWTAVNAIVCVHQCDPRTTRQERVDW